MIIDCILDRFDGLPYDPHNFYFDIGRYGLTGGYHVDDIMAALDGGDNIDVQLALIDYIITNNYPRAIARKVLSVKWIPTEEA